MTSHNDWKENWCVITLVNHSQSNLTIQAVVTVKAVTFIKFHMCQSTRISFYKKKLTISIILYREVRTFFIFKGAFIWLSKRPKCDTKVSLMWGAMQEANLPHGSAKNVLDSIGIPIQGWLRHQTIYWILTAFRWDDSCCLRKRLPRSKLLSILTLSLKFIFY